MSKNLDDIWAEKIQIKTQLVSLGGVKVAVE